MILWAPLVGLLAKVGPALARVAGSVAARMGASQAGKAAMSGKSFGDLTKSMASMNTSVDDASGKFKNIALSVGKFSGGLVTLAATTVALAKSQVALMESFRAYNTSIAQAYNVLELGRMRRRYQFASGTAGTTAELAKAMNDFEESVTPWLTLGTNVLNKILATAIGFIDTYVEHMEPILMWLEVLGFKFEEQGQDDPLGVAIREGAVWRNGQEASRPKRPPMAGGIDPDSAGIDKLHDIEDRISKRWYR